MMTRKILAIVRRRGWIVAGAAALCVYVAFWISIAQTAPWSATGVLVVPATETPTDDGFLGNPNEAARLAGSYAVLLPLDDQLLRATADAAGVSIERLSGNLEISQLDGSSLIEITMTEDSEQQAELMLSSFIEAALEPATPLITAGSLQIVRIDAPEASEPISNVAATIAGGLLGAVIGLVVVVFWERSDPRIDVASDLYGAVQVPVSQTRDVVGDQAAAIAQRWIGISGAKGPIMLIGHGEHGRTIADLLVSDVLQVRDLPRVWKEQRYEHQLEIIAADSFSDALLIAGMIVMIVTPGARLARLLADLRRHETLGTPVDWIVFDG